MRYVIFWILAAALLIGGAAVVALVAKSIFESQDIGLLASMIFGGVWGYTWANIAKAVYELID